MREKSISVKTYQVLLLIPLYYIIGNKNIFLYALTLCLYNIFVSCFTHVSIKDTLAKVNNKNERKKFFKIFVLVNVVIQLLILILSIIAGDITSAVLKIDDVFFSFLFMGLSVFTELLLNYLLDYLDAINYKKISLTFFKMYYYIEGVLLIIISLLLFRCFKINNNLDIGLMYLSKIISIAIIFVLSYFLILNKKSSKMMPTSKSNLNIHKEIKKILTNNNYISIINIVEKSYYYLSIIILYFVLSTRYNYATDKVSRIIIFVYFYGLYIIKYLVDIVLYLVNKICSKRDCFERLYYTFKMFLPLSIILGIISPLVCKVLFNSPDMAIYLVMLNFLGLNLALCQVIINSNNNKKILYISLLLSLFFKILLSIPLINAFYRMGYNLVYGDIVSSIIGFIIIIVINYVYLNYKNKKPVNYLMKIMDIIYDNIILCIILIILEFIVPIDTNNYFKSVGLMILYLIVSIMFIKIKNEKRGK